jgi:hypothetical protein
VSRFFAARASPVNSRRDVEPCSCRRPSAPFGWESLHRAATSSDTLCRSRVRCRTFLLPASCPGTPIDAPRRFPSNQDWPAMRPLGTHTRTAQSACDWVDLPFRRGGPSRRRSSYIRYDPSTLFTGSGCPPDQGCGPSRASHPSRPQQRCHAVRPLGKMPRTNLCSRFVVTSTRKNDRFPSFGLSRLRPPRVFPRFRPSGSSAFIAVLPGATLGDHFWLPSPG